jgi:putative Holliday junction resolvase
LEHSTVTRHSSVPPRGTLLGLDYGTKRIGVAVSTPEQSIASPLENYTRRNDAEDAAFLKRLASEYQAVGLVVGLPVHMSGDEGAKAKEARAFGEWAAQVCGLPVVYWDERYSSAMAELYLQQAEVSPKKRKERLDKVAAQVMLQAFLESDDRGRAPGCWPN